MIALSLLSGCSTASTSVSRSDLSGTLHLVGSTALQPFASAAAALFQNLHPRVHIQVDGGGSLFGLQALVGNRADIGDSDVFADPASFPDPNLTDHVVCIIPFVLVVGPEVTITSLTRQQILGIFATGIFKNWKQIGGPNLPVIPIVRPATSGTRAIFRQKILGGLDEKGTLLKSDSSQLVLSAVSHTLGAIGYLAVPFIDSSVHQVSIDKQVASLANIQAGHYAFWGYEHMYTLGSDNPLVASFLAFIVSPQGQRLAQQLHYIPLKKV